MYKNVQGFWRFQGPDDGGGGDPRECGLPKGVWIEICTEGNPRECDSQFTEGDPHTRAQKP